MRTTSRVNYDAIARLYDGQPYRRKTVDPELVTFIVHHASSDHLSLLDIGCGTGSQLVANRAIVPDARLVGLDRSFGMLAQALSKGSDIAWVQADGAELPFRAGGFDFICCQFGFHHLPDKAGMLGEVLRVLRPGGRFAMRNLCPQESPHWLYYEYFPEARTIDLEDFWPPDTIISTMETIGFVAVSAVPEHIRVEHDLRVWLDMVRRRDFNSQLMAISDRAYEDGMPGWNVNWRMEAPPRCEPTAFACSPFGGINSTQYRRIGMAYSRPNIAVGVNALPQLKGEFCCRFCC